MNSLLKFTIRTTTCYQRWTLIFDDLIGLNRIPFFWAKFIFELINQGVDRIIALIAVGSWLWYLRKHFDAILQCQRSLIFINTLLCILHVHLLRSKERFHTYIDIFLIMNLLIIFLSYLMIMSCFVGIKLLKIVHIFSDSQKLMIKFSDKIIETEIHIIIIPTLLGFLNSSFFFIREHFVLINVYFFLISCGNTIDELFSYFLTDSEMNVFFHFFESERIFYDIKFFQVNH